MSNRLTLFEQKMHDPILPSNTTHLAATIRLEYATDQSHSVLYRSPQRDRYASENPTTSTRYMITEISNFLLLSRRYVLSV